MHIHKRPDTRGGHFHIMELRIRVNKNVEKGSDFCHRASSTFLEIRGQFSTTSTLRVSILNNEHRHLGSYFRPIRCSPRLLRGAPLRSARNLPSTPPELLCICIVRVHTESYVDSQNSLFCLLTCNNDHKSLYMPILWYVIISPNLM